MEPTGALSAQMIEPIRVTETLEPIAVTEPKPGVFVFDLGQNIVGWCRLRVRGPAGTQVRLVHAETLQPDGTLYLANLRSAKVTDVYTLGGGDQPQQWEPRFTYHGFRYVEVTGWPGTPTLDEIEGRVVHDDVRSAGDFACSKELLNQIYKNVAWGMRGNYRSMPTDCPQRDERQGWMGDRGEECRGEMYVYDIAALYSKWVTDMEDSQKDSGSVPDVCPAHWPLYSDNVTWPSTTVLCAELAAPAIRRRGRGRPPLRQREALGRLHADVRQGRHHRSRPAMATGACRRRIRSSSTRKDPLRQTDKGVLATSYLYYDLRIMERFAKLLGKSDDAARFAAKAAELEDGVQRAASTPRELGQYDNGSQTSCVLPLAFGLVRRRARQAGFRRAGQQDQRRNEQPHRHGPHRRPVPQPRADRPRPRRPHVHDRHADATTRAGATWSTTAPRPCGSCGTATRPTRR